MLLIFRITAPRLCVRQHQFLAPNENAADELHTLQ